MFFFAENISFPDDYGIETICELDEDVEIRRANLWPDARVPIFINMSSTTIPEKYQKEQIKFVKRAIAIIEFMTCIHFVPVNWSNPQHYIHIDNSKNGCWSSVGKAAVHVHNSITVATEQGERPLTYQLLNLGYGCNNQAIVIHELMHALGIHHEHQRFDRDIYLTFNYDNIGLSSKFAFTKIFSPQTPKTPYRYDSIMHYPSYFMAIDKSIGSMVRKMTQTKITYNSTQTIATITDFNRLNYMYGCSEDSTKNSIENRLDLQ